MIPDLSGHILRSTTDADMICQFSISPIGSSESLSKDVARIIDLIDKSGHPYQTHAMGTIVEGEWDEILELIHRCHMVMAEQNSRVITTIHIDDRKHSTQRISGKIQSIEKHLGRRIKT